MSGIAGTSILAGNPATALTSYQLNSTFGPLTSAVAAGNSGSADLIGNSQFNTAFTFDGSTNTVTTWDFDVNDNGTSDIADTQNFSSTTSLRVVYDPTFQWSGTNLGGNPSGTGLLIFCAPEPTTGSPRPCIQNLAIEYQNNNPFTGSASLLVNNYAYTVFYLKTPLQDNNGFINLDDTIVGGLRYYNPNNEGNVAGNEVSKRIYDGAAGFQSTPIPSPLSLFALLPLAGLKRLRKKYNATILH